ncbi:hypothetical protein UlMin_019888 [Ulmus minor]
MSLRQNCMTLHSYNKKKNIYLNQYFRVVFVLVRIFSLIMEHTIFESKLDYFLDDLRLNNSWPKIKRFVENIDLDMSDPVAHKHIPYWAKNHGGSFPSTREEKRELKINYKEAIEASLKEFLASKGGGEAPLEGSIPDMTSSTEHYVNLQNIYLAKAEAEADFLAIEKGVRNILKKIGRDPNSVSKATIKDFVRIKAILCRFAGFYILLRAVDRFAPNYNSFPEQSDVETSNVIIRDMRDVAFSILVDESCHVSIKDQMVVMFHYVDKKGYVIECFIGIEYVAITTTIRCTNGMILKQMCKYNGLGKKKKKGIGCNFLIFQIYEQTYHYYY